MAEQAAGRWPYAHWMYLENLVFDASDPQRLGRFWQAAVGGKTLTDEPDGYETRLSVDGGPVLDLCFQRVPEPPSKPARLHLDLLGGPRQREVVDRLLGLGARHVDIGQGDVAWVVLADPEGNAFCVMEAREEYVRTGPIAAVPLDAADPAADARFWSWLTGWVLEGPGGSSTVVRHPSGRGLLLEFCPEKQPKPETKNRLHFDIRLGAGDDPDLVAAGIAERGGLELHPTGGCFRGGCSATLRATSSACSRPGTGRRDDRPDTVRFGLCYRPTTGHRVGPRSQRQCRPGLVRMSQTWRWQGSLAQVPETDDAQPDGTRRSVRGHGRDRSQLVSLSPRRERQSQPTGGSRQPAASASALLALRGCRSGRPRRCDRPRSASTVRRGRRAPRGQRTINQQRQRREARPSPRRRRRRRRPPSGHGQ